MIKKDIKNERKYDKNQGIKTQDLCSEFGILIEENYQNLHTGLVEPVLINFLFYVKTSVTTNLQLFKLPFSSTSKTQRHGKCL